MPTVPPFWRLPLLGLAASALIVQAGMAWTQGGYGAVGKVRQVASAAFVTGTLGRPIPDAYDSFVSWADRNTAPGSVILLLQPAGNADSFRYFRTSTLAYPRTIWWGDSNGPGQYPDWHIVIPAAPQARANILAKYGIDYVMLDGAPLSEWSLPSATGILCFNRQLAECLVDVRTRRP